MPMKPWWYCEVRTPTTFLCYGSGCKRGLLMLWGMVGTTTCEVDEPGLLPYGLTEIKTWKAQKTSASEPLAA